MTRVATRLPEATYQQIIPFGRVPRARERLHQVGCARLELLPGPVVYDPYALSA
jgi:hypothetical protein